MAWSLHVLGNVSSMHRTMNDLMYGAMNDLINIWDMCRSIVLPSDRLELMTRLVASILDST